jgi:Flp pilus assembly protein TadG
MRSRTTCGGQALVEFALVLPIVVLLVFALFDAGRAVWYYAELTNAARVGARVAMVNQSNDASCNPSADRTFKCAAAQQAVGMGIASASIPDLSITGTDCAVFGSCAVTVSVSYPYVPVTPVISQIIGPLSLTASSTMTIERNFTSP